MSQQGPNTYESIRRVLGNVAGARTRKTTAKISPEPLSTDSVFSSEEKTFWKDSGELETHQETTHRLLDCGCQASGPSDVRGLCPACACSFWARFRRRQRFVCRHHSMCLRCRAKRLRKIRRRGLFRRLAALILWPLFDVTNDEKEQ